MFEDHDNGNRSQNHGNQNYASSGNQNGNFWDSPDYHEINPQKDRPNFEYPSQLPPSDQHFPNQVTPTKPPKIFFPALPPSAQLSAQRRGIPLPAFTPPHPSAPPLPSPPQAPDLARPNQRPWRRPSQWAKPPILPKPPKPDPQAMSRVWR